MVVSNNDRRLNFKVAEEICKQNGIDVKNARPAYSFLRCEIRIRNLINSYKVPITQQTQYDGTYISPTEQRLSLQDNFVVGSMGMFVYFLNRTTNQPGSDLLTHIGPYNAPAGYSIGNQSPIWLGAAIPGSFTGLPNQLWQAGTMKFTMDQNVIIPYYDCLQHYLVPRTQATPASSILGTNLDPTVDPYYGFQWNMEEYDGLSSGFMPMEPNVVLSGARNNEITYNVANPVDWSLWGWSAAGLLDGTIEARVAFIFRGVLLQNTTNVK